MERHVVNYVTDDGPMYWYPSVGGSDWTNDFNHAARFALRSHALEMVHRVNGGANPPPFPARARKIYD